MSDLFRAVWRTPGNWQEGRHVRIAICTTALICSFVLPGQARPSGPLTQHVQEGQVFCGWIGVAVSPMTRAFADVLGTVQPHRVPSGGPITQKGVLPRQGPGALARADAGPAPGRGEERPAATIEGFPNASQIDSPALSVRYLLGTIGSERQSPLKGQRADRPFESSGPVRWG
jgi:hypothetical protein